MKLLLRSILISASAFGVTQPAFAAPVTALEAGLYKSTNGNLYIKMGEANESSFRAIAVVGHRLTKADYKAPYAVVFDERATFVRESDATFISKFNGCIATVTQLTAVSFKFNVNSRTECFVKYSQFNAGPATESDAKVAEPFLNQVFKLDTNPHDIEYFANF